MANYSISEPLKASPEKSQFVSCDTLVANERSVVHAQKRQWIHNGERRVCYVAAEPFWTDGNQGVVESRECAQSQYFYVSRQRILS
jgi:hypothetical protein